jgi:hypothetical protein
MVLNPATSLDLKEKKLLGKLLQPNKHISLNLIQVNDWNGVCG